MERIVLTVSREYASGGRTVAQKLGELLGGAVYDKKLIGMISEQTGFTPEYVESVEQKPTSSLLYSVYMHSAQLPASDQVFVEQTRAIRSIAEKDSCIIVGRCADYILRKDPNLLRVFLYAPLASRERRAVEEYGVAQQKARAEIRRHDKQRAAYYARISERNWGDYKNYDLMLNTDMGLDEAAELIAYTVRKRK